MRKTKPKVRRQLLTLLCAFLLFGQIFVPAAYADREQNVNISYTVTEDMLPKPVPSSTPTPRPTPTATPTATPHPGKGEPPKTGDASNIMLYGLIASGSLLAVIGLACYVKNKGEMKETDE